MIPTVAIGTLVSFAACLALTPVVRNLCLRYGAVDRPGPLKIHSHPIPRLGGLAVAISIAAGVLFSNRQDARANALFFAALAVIWLAGFVDDLRGISPYARLVAQVFSGTFLWLGGWRFTFAGQLPTSGAISLVPVCFLVVLFANSFNFLDGSDGLATGVAAIVGASYLVISRGAAADPFARLVAAYLFGSCSAFLVYNFAPAKIHLGDSGSTVLGFCAAFLASNPPYSTRPVSLLQLSPLLIAGVPLVDTSLAVVRRLTSNHSVLRGDRSHIYDQMLAREWSPRLTAVAIYAITIGLAVAAWLAVSGGMRLFLFVWALSLAGLLTFAIRLGCLGAGKEESASPSHNLAIFVARDNAETERRPTIPQS